MQLQFSWRDESAFRDELQTHAGVPVAVTLTDNSHSLLTVRPLPLRQGLQLRIHHMFLAADPPVLKALATWVTKPRCRQSGEVIDAFIRANRHLIRPRTKRITVCTQGTVHDLRALYNEVNAAHFDSTIDAHITWGRLPAARRQRSIRFGSYTVEQNLIRIHPYLDRPYVPDFFVRYVVFHEMLHAHLGIEEGPTGRRRIHTPEFNRLERQYPDYGRATAWENDPANMRRVLRSHG